MSVIIEDFKIPKSCTDCPIFYDGYYCPITWTNVFHDNIGGVDYTKNRIPNCPLKEIKNTEGVTE